MSDRPMTVEKALALVEEVFSRCGAYGNNWVMPAEHTQALFVLRAALKYRKEKP